VAAALQQPGAGQAHKAATDDEDSAAPVAAAVSAGRGRGLRGKDQLASTASTEGLAAPEVAVGRAASGIRSA
jgi:hypothetical protein